MGAGGSTLEGLEMNFFQDKRIFVTGATGLVGGFLVEKLLSLGADVITLVRDLCRRVDFYRI